MSSTLRERLEAKKRRRIVQPVQVESPSEEEIGLIADWAKAALDTTDEAETARGDIVKRLEALRDARTEDVAFSAMDPETWEKIAATHPSPEGEDAGMDWRKALPLVAALCCEDESMQDDEAWAAVLGSWGYGELVGLWSALLAINTDHPRAHLPKG